MTDDRDLLRRMLDLADEDDERLTSAERDAFEAMTRSPRLTEKQVAWIQGKAERLGLTTAPCENTFSKLTPEQQKAHRAAARRVQLPWERGEVARPLKPPRRAS